MPSERQLAQVALDTVTHDHLVGQPGRPHCLTAWWIIQASPEGLSNTKAGRRVGASYQAGAKRTDAAWKMAQKA